VVGCLSGQVRASGLERPSALRLGADLERGLQALVRARISPAEAELSFRWRASATRPELVIVHVGAQTCGIPWRGPVARVLLDRSDAGRVWLLDVHPLPNAACRVPRLDPAEAIARVEATGRPGSGGARTAQLEWADEGGRARLSWRVEPPLDPQRLVHPVWWVDDETGAVRQAFDRSRAARVRAWPINPIATPGADLFELADIDPMPAHLEGPWFAAANCLAPANGEGWCYRERTAVPDLAGDFLYPLPDLDADPDPQDAFAEAAAYYHLDRYFEWLRARGLDRLDCHDEGEVVEVVVNRRKYSGGAWEPWDNAGYTGSCGASTVVLGQGMHDFAYDGDIVYHELSHAVIERFAGETLGLEHRREDALGFDATAIDEGVADFLAAAFTGDPLIAEWAFPTGGRPLDGDFRCPEDLTGEAHADGQIVGGALWDAHAVVGEDLIGPLFDALAMIDADVSFEDLAVALTATTEASLGDEASAAVRDAFDARGLLDCPRVLAFEQMGAGGVHEDLGLERLLHVRSPRMGTIYSPAAPPPLQWALEVPPDADRATLRFSFVDELSVAQNLALGVRRGGPIHFGYEVDGSQVAVDADTDEVVFGADDGEVSFGVEPDSVVHAALFHTGTGDAATDRWLLLSDFRVEWSCVAPDGCAPQGETGDEGDEDPGGEGSAGGCGCAAGGGPVGPTGLAVGLIPWRRRLTRATRTGACASSSSAASSTSSSCSSSPPRPVPRPRAPARWA
jgi:hypothetical protein